MSEASGALPGHVTGFGTKGYRTYVLFSLMAVYTLNFIDRTLISVVAQPIINTFGLTDGQFGLLAGPPFAIFYALMGIPIAMLADRGNRVLIIAVCVVLWSLMTAFCGLATSFLWLLVFRVGVAVGEAGCSPPANAIIADYYPQRSRAGAIGIYSMGVTIGGVLAQLFGGSIAGIEGSDFGAFIASIGLGGLFGGLDWSTVEGWRIAFVVIGAPGVLVALIIMLTMKEPPRGYSDPPEATPARKSGMGEAFREFGRKPSFWWMALGASLVAFVGYGLISFQAPFLQRVHNIGVREAAIYYGAPLAAFATVGTFMGGFLSEKLSGRFASVVAWLPALAIAVSVPLYIFAFFSDNLMIAFVFWAIAAVLHYMYLGAQYTIGQGVVSPRSRATTIAVLLLIISLIGNGIGPPFVGELSDFFMSMNLEAAGLSEVEFDPRLCATDLASLGERGTELCLAYSEGLRQSMATTILFLLVAAFAYFMSSRSYVRDLWKPEEAPAPAPAPTA